MDVLAAGTANQIGSQAAELALIRRAAEDVPIAEAGAGIHQGFLDGGRGNDCFSVFGFQPFLF